MPAREHDEDAPLPSPGPTAASAGAPATPTPAAAVDQPLYDASAITVLEGLDAVRKRPGMYIGSTSERGLHHLVWEIVDNAVDEALAGEADRVDVTILADGGVRVRDNGRGIPTDMHATEGVSAVELVLTQLHAGGKFGGGGYKVSGGLHGVGSSVVNALSSRLDAEVRQKGHVFRMSFHHGVPVAPLARMEPSEEHGTTITFWANPEIFDSVDYKFETIRARFQQTAFLNKGLTIALTDEREEAVAVAEDVFGEDEDSPDAADGQDFEQPASGAQDDAAAAEEARVGGVRTDARGHAKARTATYRYDGGLVDYVKHLNASKKT
ncbi:MAG: ATP-binding protein, partial [Micrococcales bacterium]|nr:ATP-binding protein [Micrococcales bacterium]